MMGFVSARQERVPAGKVWGDALDPRGPVARPQQQLGLPERGQRSPCLCPKDQAARCYQSSGPSLTRKGEERAKPCPKMSRSSGQ